MHHYPDLGSVCDWLKQISHVVQPIRSTTQIWVVTRHQYGLSALFPQTSFRRETSGGIVKCWLFSQASNFSSLVYFTNGQLKPSRPHVCYFGDGLELYLIQLSTSTTINSMFSSSIKVLNSPESCCGLRENTVLRIASDIGEEYCNNFDFY